MKLQRFFAGLTALCLLMGLAGSVSAAQAEVPEAEQAIIESCTYGIKTDISQYGLDRDGLEALFYSLRDSGKLPWYTAATYTCYYDTETGIVQEFEPDSLDEAVYDTTRYEQRVAQALAECVYEGMTPVQIALSIHDWLVVSCIYDETLEKNTGYDLLVNGTTVCAGYAEAYQDLLTRVGIECVTVTSEEMEHAWNLVKLDGQWYHVDVTWDDPSPDAYGYVGHDYFLLTDQQISTGDDPHYGWETDITCTDSRFSDGYWKGVNSRICFTDSTTAYLVRTEDWVNRVYARDEATGAEDLIYTDKKDYIDIGHGEYCYGHGSLSLWNGRLYYNRMNKLLSMDLDGGDQYTEYSHKTRSSGNYLYTCHIVNDTLYATAADHNGDKTSFNTSLESTGYHVHSYAESTQAPACTEPGYTLSSCQCGLTAKSKPVAPTGHSYQRVEGRIATFWSDGYSTQTCDTCGDTTTVELPRIDFAEWVKENPGLSLAVIIGVILICSKLGKKKVKA